MRAPRIPLNRLTGRLRWVGGAGAAVVVGAVVIGGTGLLSPAQAAPGDTTEATSTAAVERRTLASQEEFSGTLGYSGDLRVVNELLTSGSADVSSLSQAVVSAQAAYDNAVRTLAAIKHPTAQNIAAARAQVRSAEASLLSARTAAKGPGAAQLESAAAQLAQAQATLAAAKASANGPTASQLAQAQAQLAQANASLVAAQNAANGPSGAQRTQAEAAVTTAQITLSADQGALVTAQQALAVCQAGSGVQPTPDPTATPSATPAATPTPDCSAQSQAVAQASARVAADQQNLLVAQAQLADLTSAANQSAAQAGLTAAQAQVATAQAALAELTGPDAAASAQAQLAAAAAAARSAQASLDDLTSPDAKAQANAQVNAAQAQLQSAQASLAAILNPTPAAMAEAASNVNVTKASLDAAKARLEQLRGTVTWLPEEGAIVDRGDPLYELDGEPSGILLFGARPAWRSMAEGMDGEDVRQLQENLIALGFDDDLTASGSFDAATTGAVKAWQKRLGRPETGTVELGAVVFQPGAVRVAAHTVAVGDTVSAGMQVLSGTSTERVVVVDLDADQQDLVSEGDEVDVDLPDDTTTTGHVQTVGTVATAADAQSAPTIEVSIVLDDPEASGTIDQAPVNVQVTTISRENVLAVPVNALLALLEGGYAVEVAAADGTTHLVGVETGIFQDGWVEIEPTTGELSEGDQVVVPA
jgi:multidrug efflux pump subunit AcrA (membrane-fusion protein)